MSYNYDVIMSDYKSDFVTRVNKAVRLGWEIVGDVSYSDGKFYVLVKREIDNA